MGLAGRTAVVTGTAHGIGTAIAKALAEDGATVHGVDKDTADLTGPQAVAEFFAGIGAGRHPGQQRRRRGRPDRQAAGGRATDEDWHAVVDANLTSAYLCIRAVVPGMKERGWGRIVNISSAAGPDRQPDRHPGLRQRQGRPDRADPAAGRRARPVRHHGQLHRARASSCPTRPPRSSGTATAPRARPRWWRGISMRRLGQPEDIAHGVQFFAAERSGWVTGQTIAIDGGHAFL